MEENLPRDHKDVGLAYNNIGVAYYHLRQDSLALSSFKKALEIYRKSLPDDHELVQDCKRNIEMTQPDVRSYRMH